MGKFLSPEKAWKIMELAKGSYRPKEIVQLKEEIEGETRAAELNMSVTGVFDEERIQKIVQMKLQLDGPYGDWTEGKIS